MLKILRSRIWNTVFFFSIWLLLVLQIMCLVGACYEWVQIAWHCTNMLFCCKTVNNLNEVFFAHYVFVWANNWLVHGHNSNLGRHAECSIVLVGVKKGWLCSCVHCMCTAQIVGYKVWIWCKNHIKQSEWKLCPLYLH